VWASDYFAEWRYYRKLERQTLRLLHSAFQIGSLIRTAQARGYELDELHFLSRADELEEDFVRWLRDLDYRGVELPPGLRHYLQGRRSRL